MPRHILIIDDQTDILLILERKFREIAGVSVKSTGSLAEALSLLASKPFDLVISDVRLGRDSGFDLVREVNRSYPGVGSILMSAYRSSTNRQQAEALGVILFLEKPFQIAELIQAVKDYFEAKENPQPGPGLSVPAAHAAAPELTRTNSLSHFKLEDLVQLFCLNGRNIQITITPQESAPIGEIYIQGGQMVHVDFNGMTGDEGFLALMQLQDPKLKVKDWTSPVPVTVESGWDKLLLQSAIQTDELLDRQATGSD
jgi:CheY-like chemotaxis protein